jgi:hypothetical protein
MPPEARTPRVAQHVLTIGRAVFSASEQLHEFRVDVEIPSSSAGAFTGFAHVLLSPFAFFDDLLHPRGMIRPSETVSRASARTSRRSGSKQEITTASGVSSTMTSPRELFESADVAAFAADDPPFHITLAVHAETVVSLA